MKRLLLLISFTFLFLFSFTQTDVQRDNRVSPILKQALASKGGYYIYGRTGSAEFINIAVLNQSSHKLCWFTCHGRVFDSTKLTFQEFEQVTSKRLDPFVLYQNICDKYLADFAAAKDIYRVYGDVQLFDKIYGNYRALFAMETVQAAKTRLQKLIAIENVRKKIFTQLAYLNCGSPFGLHDDPLYKISKEQAGAMIQSKDSTVYYNIDPTSAVTKISLYKKSAGQLYIQNRFSEVIDSVAIQPEKYDLLQKEKTDVFLLYRGWLEMQWQGALSAIRRQGAGLYNQVNAQNEKEVKELYNQLNAIGAKINQLNSPEAKSIEQAVYDTYKNETSEISYMPLLGIGYSLTQTRGQKEYELTNHLGNVLVTVTDKKIGVSSPSNSSLIDHYEPDIVSAQDYFPFGMLQPGRSYLSPNGDKYRYGFNGKENDNEVKGEGNQQDYGMRVYDPRLGKFLSVDPLTTKFPELTPYQFASNRPIDGIDMDGLEYSPASSNNGNPRDASAVQTGVNPEAVVKRMMDRNKRQTSVIPLNAGGNATLSQSPIAGNWEASESAGQNKRNAYNKEMYDRARLDPVGFGVPFTMFNATNEFVKGTANHAYGIYEGIEDRNGWGIAKNTFLLALDLAPFLKVGGSSVKFFSVQSDESVSRLMAGGEPWPTSPTSAHLGQGLYAWGTKAEAEAYMNALSRNMPQVNLKIMEFSITKSQLKNLNGFAVSADDEIANKWLETHSSLYGQGTPHGFNYVQRMTSMGVEHYFSKQAFQLFKVKVLK